MIRNFVLVVAVLALGVFDNQAQAQFGRRLFGGGGGCGGGCGGSPAVVSYSGGCGGGGGGTYLSPTLYTTAGYPSSYNSYASYSPQWGSWGGQTWQQQYVYQAPIVSGEYMAANGFYSSQPQFSTPQTTSGTQGQQLYSSPTVGNMTATLSNGQQVTLTQIGTNQFGLPVYSIQPQTGSAPSQPQPKEKSSSSKQ